MTQPPPPCMIGFSPARHKAAYNYDEFESIASASGEMKFLKALAIGLCGIFLALSLLIFGLAFTVNSTILNPAFINREINELEVAALVRELASDEITMDGEVLPKEIVTALTTTVTDLEPLLKERLNAFVTSTYDYLLGKDPKSFVLARTLRNTIVKKDFFIAVVDKLDIASLTRPLLKQQLGSEQVPPEFQKYLDPAFDQVISDFKPWLKAQIETAADPVLDYLLGQRDSFNIVISMDTLKTRLTDSLQEMVVASPPPELASLPPAEREAILAQFLPQIERMLAAMIPPTIEINEKLLGTEVRARILEGTSAAEGQLVEVRSIIAGNYTLTSRNICAIV